MANSFWLWVIGSLQQLDWPSTTRSLSQATFALTRKIRRPAREGDAEEFNNWREIEVGTATLRSSWRVWMATWSDNLKLSCSSRRTKWTINRPLRPKMRALYPFDWPVTSLDHQNWVVKWKATTRFTRLIQSFSKNVEFWQILYKLNRIDLKALHTSVVRRFALTKFESRSFKLEREFFF